MESSSGGCPGDQEDGSARGGKRPGRRRRRVVGLVRACLLGGLPAIVAAPALAQTTYVGNFDDTMTILQELNSDSEPYFADAQRFTTGSEAGGYALGSVDVFFYSIFRTSRTLSSRSTRSTPTARRTAQVYALTAPASITSGSSTVVTFEAPSGATLEPSTTYTVVMKASGGFVLLNSSTAESPAEPGWSIADHVDNGTTTASERRGTKKLDRTRSIQIEIKGPGSTTSTDATLSDLELEDLDTPANTIALNPAFSSTGTSYAAFVAGDVDEITIKPVVNDAGAEYEVFDDDDMMLTDDDTGEDDFQTSLETGENVFKIKVTAEDDMTTETYTVYVSRGPLWSTTLTIGMKPDALASGVWRQTSPNWGSLADTTFTFLGGSFEGQNIAATADGVTFRPRRKADDLEDLGLVLDWAGQALPLADATLTPQSSFVWSDTWIDSNASSLSADNYRDTLPVGGTGTVCLRAATQPACATAVTAPTNSDATGRPGITGDAEVGTTLSTSLTGIDDDNGELAARNGIAGYAWTYQWFRVDADGTSNKTQIAGETSAQYTVTNSDDGKRLIVEVSFKDDANNDEGPLASLASGNNAPTGAPTISGTATVGQTLTASTAGIADEDGKTKADNDDTGYAWTYQWFRVDEDGTNEAEITGATSQTYVLTASEKRKRVIVKVSFTDDEDNPEGPLPSASYPSTGTIDPLNADATGTPSITGNAQEGETLTADRGTITDANGITKAINGDTGYAVHVHVVPRGRGRDVEQDPDRVRHVGDLPAGRRGGRQEGHRGAALQGRRRLRRGPAGERGVSVDRHDRPAPQQPDATGTPEVQGTPQVGQSLLAQLGTIADDDGLTTKTFPTDYSFQWYKDGSAISGAIGQSYFPHVLTDVGAQLHVEVSFYDDNGNFEARESAEVGPVLRAAENCSADRGGNNWCTQMTVGTAAVTDPVTVFWGVNSTSSFGEIVNDSHRLWQRRSTTAPSRGRSCRSTITLNTPDTVDDESVLATTDDHRPPGHQCSTSAPTEFAVAADRQRVPQPRQIPVRPVGPPRRLRVDRGPGGHRQRQHRPGAGTRHRGRAPPWC